MLRKIKNISDFIDSKIKHMIIFLMGILVLSILVQIFYRFLIVKHTGRSFPYVYEGARYLLIWITYLTIAINLKENSHPFLDLFINKLPPRGQKIMYIFHGVLIFIFSILIIVKGKGLIELTKNITTPTLEISIAWIYAAPVIGSMLILINLIPYIVNKIDDISKKENM